MGVVKVYITNQQKAVKIPSGLRLLIRKCCHAVLEMENFGKPAEVSVTFVDNKEIQTLNREYRGIDRPTDVLSFALDEGDEEPEVEDGEAEHLLGDVIISAPRAVEQGEEFGHGLTREMTYLAVHGMLHLLGYDHMEEADKRVMRAREEEILRELDLAEENYGG